ncbi:hypothetical protein MHTCC0001_08390 [Flavobacteriaceae bacterium MHTCC 0001]
MKNALTFSLLFVFVFSCSRNDFIDTEINLETNKESYFLQDEIELKIIIYPTVEKKTIRFNKNLNNIDILFVPMIDEFVLNEKLKKYFIEGPSLFGDDSEFIDEFAITKENPFEKVFYGTISEAKDKIYFEIPELKVNDKIDKSLIAENPIILIKGSCRAVYGSEEKYFEKKIKILIE